MHRRSFLVSQSLVVDTNKTDFVSNYVHISYSYIKVIFSTYIARRRKVLSLYRLIKVIVIFYVIVRFL